MVTYPTRQWPLGLRQPFQRARSAMPAALYTSLYQLYASTYKCRCSFQFDIDDSISTSCCLWSLTVRESLSHSPINQRRQDQDEIRAEAGLFQAPCHSQSQQRGHTGPVVLLMPAEKDVCILAYRSSDGRGAAWRRRNPPLSARRGSRCIFSTIDLDGYQMPLPA